MVDEPQVRPDVSVSAPHRLDQHEYTSVEQMKGSVSQANFADPVAYARSNYMQMLVNFTSPYDWREIPGSVQT